MLMRNTIFKDSPSSSSRMKCFNRFFVQNTCKLYHLAGDLFFFVRNGIKNRFQMRPKLYETCVPKEHISVCSE